MLDPPIPKLYRPLRIRLAWCRRCLPNGSRHGALATMVRIAAVLMAMLAPIAADAASIGVTLHVTGIQRQKGEIFAGLYDAAGWGGDHWLSAAHVVVNASDVTLRLTAPGPGVYAIKLFQDLNGTGKLARNFLGMPTEPYAFSNNAKGNMGPPAFKSAAFNVTADGTSQDVNLQ